MTTFLDTVSTEKDPPRSRNTLDDDDEEEARLHRLKFPKQVPEFTKTAELPDHVDVVIVSIGKSTSQLVESALQSESLGHLTTDAHVCEIRKFTSADNNAGILFCTDETISDDDSALWARRFFETVSPASTPVKVIVVDTMKTTEYSCNGERCEPPLVRGIGVSPVGVEAVSEMGLELLESGNIIKGLCAAVMSQCVYLNVEHAFALLSLREAHLEVDSMMALVNPLVSALKSCGVPVDASALKSKASSIREVRAIDREQLYV